MQLVYKAWNVLSTENHVQCIHNASYTVYAILRSYYTYAASLEKHYHLWNTVYFVWAMLIFKPDTETAFKIKDFLTSCLCFIGFSVNHKPF